MHFVRRKLVVDVRHRKVRGLDKIGRARGFESMLVVIKRDGNVRYAPADRRSDDRAFVRGM